MRINVIRPFGPCGPIPALAIGEHDLSDDLVDHWFIKGCIASGLVKVIDQTPVGITTAGVSSEMPVLLPAALLAVQAARMAGGIQIIEEAPDVQAEDIPDESSEDIDAPADPAVPEAAVSEIPASLEEAEAVPPGEIASPQDAPPAPVATETSTRSGRSKK